jgi:hypothetical protein
MKDTGRGDILKRSWGNIYQPDIIYKRISQVKPVSFHISDSLSILIPFAFFGIETSLHILPTFQDPLRQTISSYVWSNYGLMATIAFYIIGIIIAILSIRLFFSLSKTRLSKIGALLLTLVGLDLILVAIFPTRQPGDPMTIQFVLHIFLAFSIAAIFPIAILLLNPSLKARGWSRLYKYTFFVSGFSLLVNIVALVVIIFDLNLLGILERLMILNALIWIEVVAVRLLLSSNIFSSRLKKVRS